MFFGWEADRELHDKLNIICNIIYGTIRSTHTLFARSTRRDITRKRDYQTWLYTAGPIN